MMHVCCIMGGNLAASVSLERQGCTAAAATYPDEPGMAAMCCCMCCSTAYLACRVCTAHAPEASGGKGPFGGRATPPAARPLRHASCMALHLEPHVSHTSDLSTKVACGRYQLGVRKSAPRG